MKKILLFLCMLLSLSVIDVRGINESSKPVEINKGTAKDPDKVLPRTPVSITCTYNEGILYFTFWEDLGELEITLTNQSTGTTTIYPYDGVSGSVVVGVSNESAPYLIEIETISGDCYYGEYTL